jgi:hypothetical protein
MRDIRHVHGRLEDMVESASRRFQDGGDVGDDAARLRVEVGEAALGVGRIDGKLAGHVDEAFVDQRLRVVAAGGGSIWGRNRSHEAKRAGCCRPVDPWSGGVT